MPATPYDIIAIGGSAGSIPVIIDVLEHLPEILPVPVIIVVHRLRNVQSEMTRMLSANRPLIEPEDKEYIRKGRIYLAPQNYHLLVESDFSFSLDYSELVNYSRPSIDLTFQCIAEVYKERTLAFLLSGANKDGAEGLLSIIGAGGKGLVQDPATSEFPAMPQAVLAQNPGTETISPRMISEYILKSFKMKY